LHLARAGHGHRAQSVHEHALSMMAVARR
jgi:hypothetical protein